MLRSAHLGKADEGDDADDGIAAEWFVGEKVELEDLDNIKAELK